MVLTGIINVMHSSECPNCKGRKFINGSLCHVCKGTGEKVEAKKINCKNSSKVKNGTKLIFLKSNAGTNGMKKR